MLTPIVFADRVKDTSTTATSGNFTLSGSAPSGFVAFDAAFGHAGNYFYYTIDGGSEWETGIGHLSAATTLVRDSVLASSNAGSVVTFSAGSKNVFCDLAASGIPQVSVLSSDVTYTNNNTLANTNLSLTVVAGGVYQVTVVLNVTNAAFSTGFKMDFNGGSATATSFRGTLFYGSTATIGNIVALTGGMGTNNFSANSVTFNGTFIVNAAGTLIIRASQNTSGSDTATLLTGSYLILTRIG